MKKAISAALSLLLVIGVIASIYSAPVYAAAAYEQDGLFYELQDDGTALVTGCEDYMDSIMIMEDKLFNGYRVAGIADSAFSGNLNILSFSVGIPLEYIGDYAFESCSHLKSIDFSEGEIKRIGKGAFSMCSSLKNAVTGKKIEKIDDGAFFFDKALASFNFPKSLKSIGEYSFAYSGLNAVVMNNGIKEIPARAFYGCDVLQNVSFSKNLTKIGDYAFTRCGHLDVENFPESLDEIGKYAFSECHLSELSFNGSTIGEKAFAQNLTKIDSLTFSDNLKKVDKLAFSHTEVEDFELPDNVKLENGAFAGLKTEKYTLSKTNKSYIVENGVVYTKDKKTLVYYPSEKGFDSPEPDEPLPTYTYKIKSGVTEISPYAFYYANCITKVDMPDSLTTIGEHAFESDDYLTELKIPDGVKKIGDYTFARNSSLEKVDLGSVEEIGELAFMDSFEGDATVKVPDTLKSFNPKSFAQCSFDIQTEKACKFEDGLLLTADGKKLLFCSKTDKNHVTIPDGVEEICENAFMNCAQLYTFNIPSTLTKIGESLEHSVNYLYGYEFVDFKDDTKLIGNASQGVKDYADEHNIGLFSKAPTQNIKSVTLNGKQTAKFTIDGALGTVYYFSNDDKIASVSSDGTIKALSKGTTYVVAAIGATYFRCKVTVTSDSGFKYTGFDDSPFYTVSKAAYDNWRKHYLDNNKDLAESFIEESDEPAMAAYQGNTFYRAMNGAEVPGSDNNMSGAVEFGDGYEKMIGMINHACNLELGRYKNPDNMVLYSGAKPYAASLIAGKHPTLKKLIAAKGNKFSHAQYISTSLSPAVANNFYSSGEGVVMIIYADKEALDKLPSGLIAAMHSDFEYEQLFATGSQFEVIDAGVRWYNDKDWNESGVTRYQRYVKLRLLGGSASPQKVSRTITVKNAPKSLYIKQTASFKTEFNNVYERELKYSSSNSKVLKVSSGGKLTALKKGTATITVYSSEAKTTFKVTVKNPKLNKTKLSLKKGKSFKLKLTGKVGKVTFKSSDKKTASVTKSGKITAKKEGKAKITVKCSGIKLYCKVTVK